MIGPDHYRAAEGLLRAVRDDQDPDGNSDLLIAAAQVHATLALASATALGIDPTPDAVALWDDLVLNEDAIVEHVDPARVEDSHEHVWTSDDRCTVAGCRALKGAYRAPYPGESPR